MPEQKQKILAFDRAFFFYWQMATAWGWLLGWLVLSTIALPPGRSHRRLSCSVG